MERKPKKGARGHRPIFALLSRKKTLYSTRRLLEAARARGFRTKVVDVLRCNLVIERGRPRILIAAEELSGVAVAGPRPGAPVAGGGPAGGGPPEARRGAGGPRPGEITPRRRHTPPPPPPP